MNTATTATESHMSHEMQLATLLGIKSLFNDGFNVTAIAGILEGKVKAADERGGWEKAKANVDQGAPFNISLIGTGLFSPSVERIFAIVDRSDRAIETAIELLKTIR
ncbi:hypothetical protein HBO10_29625 [Pseudomonas sp. WS 5503]|uniref:hypothetical protein n=1 Tax=Pseudomonas TaxID=286 RepID=UPI0014727B50|nr:MULTISPECIES: hypothetical protein [Pseudomonas]MBF6043424.1 hypothetical protein [Pseudomonas mucoides]NMX83668.1 hypothetical protein [Pseudomonas sp. WS 5503]NNB23624.1 hypothetical protein [Pseudomonas fragi]